MRAARNEVMSKVVALAWAAGQVSSADVAALLGVATLPAQTALSNGVRGGHLQALPHAKPLHWCLSPERVVIIASLPNVAELRASAEKLVQVVRRVRPLQAAAKLAAKLAARQARQAALSHAQAAKASAKAARRAERAAAHTASKSAAKADRSTARAAAQAKAKAAATSTISGHRRPPNLPGSRPGSAQVHRDAPVHDPKGLLRPRPPEPAPVAPILLRGGLLHPNDGPYIRPGSLDHLAAPSRSGDALAAHRAPLSVNCLRQPCAGPK